LAAATPPAAAATAGATNPYTPPTVESMTGPAPIVGGAVENQRVSTTEIVNYSWGIWKSNLGLLVGITLVTGGVMMVAYFIMVGFFVAMVGIGGGAGPGVGIALGGILLLVVFLAAAMFLSIGYIQVLLKLARRQPASFSDLFGGGSRVFPAIGCVALYYLVLLPIFILFGVLVATLGEGSAAAALLNIVLNIGITILNLIIWPFMYLVIDGKSTVLTSYASAAMVTKGNRLTSFLIGIVFGVVMVVGFLALGIGAIFAAPLALTFWVVGYLMMSNQLIVGGASSEVAV